MVRPLFLVLFACLLMGGTQSRPTDQNEGIGGYGQKVNVPVIKIGFTDVPPKRIFTSNGVDGYHAEIFTELGRRAKMKTQFVKCSLTDCLEMMKSGELDLMANLLPDKSRDAYLDFLPPAFTNKLKTSFYVRTGSNLRIKGFEDLAGQRVGVRKGVKYFDKFDNDRSIKKVTFNERKEVMVALINGKIDVFLGPDYQVDYEINRLKLQGQIRKVRYANEQTFSANYFAMSKASKLQSKRKELVEAIRSMHDDASIEAITAKFMQRYLVKYLN